MLFSILLFFWIMWLGWSQKPVKWFWWTLVGTTPLALLNLVWLSFQRYEMGRPTLGHWTDYATAMVVWFVFMAIVGGLLYRLARYISVQRYGVTGPATADGATNES